MTTTITPLIPGPRPAPPEHPPIAAPIPHDIDGQDTPQPATVAARPAIWLDHHAHKAFGSST